jgi:hypothetical protein
VVVATLYLGTISDSVLEAPRYAAAKGRVLRSTQGFAVHFVSEEDMQVPLLHARPMRDARKSFGPMYSGAVHNDVTECSENLN